MPSNVTAKIKSAPKRVVLVALLIMGIGASILIVHHSIVNVRTLRVGGHAYTLDVARSPDARAQGLGDRVSMPTNKGMLFVFDQPGIQCFWMKDMHFSLDMIWVSADKRIEHIESNVAPRTYPRTYCPDVPAAYVLELRAGQSGAVGLHKGQQLNF